MGSWVEPGPPDGSRNIPISFTDRALAADTFAVWTMRLFLGNHLDFVVRQVSLTAVWKGPFLVLGGMLGAVGALYNSTIIGLLNACDRLIRISTLLRAALIGATIGFPGSRGPTP